MTDISFWEQVRIEFSNSRAAIFLCVGSETFANKWDSSEFRLFCWEKVAEFLKETYNLEFNRKNKALADCHTLFFYSDFCKSDFSSPIGCRTLRTNFLNWLIRKLK